MTSRWNARMSAGRDVLDRPPPQERDDMPFDAASGSNASVEAFSWRVRVARLRDRRSPSPNTRGRSRPPLAPAGPPGASPPDRGRAQRRPASSSPASALRRASVRHSGRGSGRRPRAVGIAVLDEKRSSAALLFTRNAKPGKVVVPKDGLSGRRDRVQIVDKALGEPGHRVCNRVSNR